MNTEKTASSIRKKSQETILKLQLRTTRKGIVSLQKKVTQFETLAKEMESSKSDLAKLVAAEASTKSALIKEMGLD